MPLAKDFSLESRSTWLSFITRDIQQKKKKEDKQGILGKREPTVNKYSNNTHSMMTDGMRLNYIF